MQQIARLQYAKIAPRKARLIANVLRGLTASEAEAQLLHQRQRAAKLILKLLRSAVANAKSGKRLDPDRLIIGRIQVDQGPMLKRSLPRARGMATPIQKKTSHLTLVLEEGAAPRPPRFKIIIPKKVKLPPGEGKPKTRKTAQAESEERAKTRKLEKPGFFKRFFRRKSV
ncbi:MAG: 50S ribosomal protein L22 [Candidatus Liptonbacteria bacterium RIFCSPLOWO2_01_FULL_56_20]|uniref:Large ribosomal subunit protein uL22 n=1 Tax=Candidatus Liptonbacteria bacterium RIFCSPLOWO2_01_FULL_56_20 TaxID=1798652 RepID=A0A1G2CM93_9BACT|nr:MAG: 50S ribosomal protein L22 [Parcubacteria group bacterium GW2011_GWB1_56_8]OGY97930.1 MAG: 50S ribosomal protein L22 [Candidatus Liptonbacteria bacterium RIFCSPHIGHO2_01_FULL_56_18b]OGZ01568.1 MAG: 50S ribosomal protein L22 [Candidatus Liptonbacteria bacterium RIFCSPLOWO2_01_FULL_56_20]